MWGYYKFISYFVQTNIGEIVALNLTVIIFGPLFNL